MVYEFVQPNSPGLTPFSPSYSSRSRREERELLLLLLLLLIQSMHSSHLIKVCVVYNNAIRSLTRRRRRRCPVREYISRCKYEKNIHSCTHRNIKMYYIFDVLLLYSSIYDRPTIHPIYSSVELICVKYVTLLNKM